MINSGMCSCCNFQILNRDHAGKHTVIRPEYTNILIVLRNNPGEGEKILESRMQIPCCKTCANGEFDYEATYQKYLEKKDPNAMYYESLEMKPVGFEKILGRQY